jgi:hypothetical protein
VRAEVSIRADCRRRLRIVTPVPWNVRSIAAAGLATMIAAALGGCGGTSSPRLPTRTTPLESIFEAGPALIQDPAGTLDTLRRLGVERVKVFVPWGDIAPDPTSKSPPANFDGADPAAYPAANWARYDTIVRDAAARGLGVGLSIGHPPPLWAATPGGPDGGIHPQWKPSASDYGAFVRAVGTRYSGHYVPPGATTPLPRVSFWSIWNEPNYGPDLAPQATDHSAVEVSPALYRGLLNAAWSALAATGHRHDTILIGELAPRGQVGGSHPGNFDGMVPLRFIRALYCVDSSFKPLRGAAAAARHCPATAAGSHSFVADNPALFHATGFADHPYPQGTRPPTFVTPNEPGYADFATLSHLIATLDRAEQAYGSPTRFGIWSTEFGYKTDPPLAEMSSPATAAGLLNWSEYLSWRNPRVRSFDQYLLVDPPGNGESNFVTGLEFADGGPKATYFAYRMPLWLPQTTFQRGQAIEVWGCVRPARYARMETGHEQMARIQFQRASTGPFVTVAMVRVGPSCYLDSEHAFPGSGAIRAAWSYPHGATIYSRTVPVTAR